MANLKIKVGAAIEDSIDIMLCNESRFKTVSIPDLLGGKPPTFKIKGVGKFMFYFQTNVGVVSNVIIRNKQSNTVVFNENINHSKAFLINKTEVEDVTYEFSIYDVSGSPIFFYYAVSCAMPDDGTVRVFFPNKVFLFNNNGTITVNNFPVVIFNRQLTGYDLDYTIYNPPMSFVSFGNNGSSSSHPESNGNFTWIQERLRTTSVELPSVGTVQSGYSIAVNLQGVEYNFNFAAEVIDNQL